MLNLFNRDKNLSMLDDANATTTFEFTQSPVECYKLRFVAIYCILLLTLSVSFNSMLVIVFVKYKELRTPLNTFIIAITVCNLCSSCVELPFVITSNLNCGWTFGKSGCILSGFIMYFSGCASIYLMVAISIERFYILYKPLSIREMNSQVSVFAILFCLLNGLLWALFPIFGW